MQDIEFLEKEPWQKEDPEYIEKMKYCSPLSNLRKLWNMPWKIELKEGLIIPKVKKEDVLQSILLCMTYACRETTNFMIPIRPSFPLQKGSFEYVEQAIEHVEKKRLKIMQIVTNNYITGYAINSKFNLNAKVVLTKARCRDFVFLLPEPEFVGFYSENKTHYRCGIKLSTCGTLLES